MLRPVLRTLRLQTRACFGYVGERLLCGAFLGRGQLGGRHGRQPRGSFKPRAGLFTSDTDAVLLVAKPHQAGPAGVVPPAAHPLRSSPRVRRPWRQLWPGRPSELPAGQNYWQLDPFFKSLRPQQRSWLNARSNSARPWPRSNARRTISLGASIAPRCSHMATQARRTTVPLCNRCRLTARGAAFIPFGWKRVLAFKPA